MELVFDINVTRYVTIPSSSEEEILERLRSGLYSNPYDIISDFDLWDDYYNNLNNDDENSSFVSLKDNSEQSTMSLHTYEHSPFKNTILWDNLSHKKLIQQLQYIKIL